MPSHPLRLLPALTSSSLQTAAGGQGNKQTLISSEELTQQLYTKMTCEGGGRDEDENPGRRPKRSRSWDVWHLLSCSASRVLVKPCKPLPNMKQTPLLSSPPEQEAEQLNACIFHSVPGSFPTFTECDFIARYPACTGRREQILR